jgi:hypothetical protein
MKIRTDCSDSIFQKELAYRFAASKELTLLHPALNAQQKADVFELSKKGRYILA